MAGILVCDIVDALACEPSVAAETFGLKAVIPRRWVNRPFLASGEPSEPMLGYLMAIY